MMDAETQAIFQQEAEELVESLQAGLLGLDRTPEDMELVGSVFRDLHTLKGTGAMFGFDRLAKFVHDFEAAFDRVRSGEAQVTPGLIEVALRAYDLIVDLLNGEDPEAELDDILKKDLATVTGAGDAAAPASEAKPATSKTEQSGGWVLKMRLPEDFLQIGGNPIGLLDELRDLGDGVTVSALVDQVPGIAEIDESELHIGWEITLPGSVTEAQIEDVFLFHRDQMQFDLQAVGADQEDKAAPTVADAPQATAAAAKTEEKPAAKAKAKPAAVAQMRVSADRLDDIMDKVGELVIAEARLSELTSDAQDGTLKGVIEDIQRLALGLRDTTMAIRMTPIDSIMGRFHRLARDLGTKTGKTFDFVVEGETTELDKTVIERLSDPLVHMLRNAVDHGLEMPDVRLAAGKPEKGTVKLSARYSGADVLISISDDGKGLDPDMIRSRAIERGLIAEDANLSQRDIFALILEPGFSTAQTVTDLSGRGVGTDVVKQTVESLRGSIEIDSVKGQGSTFSLRLPLTLAIMDGLLIQVGDERFTIPLAAVQQIIEVPAALRGDDSPIAMTEIREALVPVLRLRSIFDCEGAHDPHPKIVVVETSDLRVGLVVDCIIGSYQTVIKQLSPLLSHMKMFSGATILGDGTVALIIDVAQLVLSQKVKLKEKDVAA
jgi:two-component system chemotaxis sensor kinase CheA